MRSVGEQLKGLLRHGLFQNTLFLYGVQLAAYLFPLATIPYLARVLGPTTWGLVAFSLAFGVYVSLLVEYGFDLSATRDVSLYRDVRDRLADLLAGVLGAKVLLALLAIGITFLVQRWVPIFRDHPALLWAGLFAALGQSFSLAWYYQGLERMRSLAALDISARALATAGIFLLVRSPEDGWKVLALQGLAAFSSMAVASGLAHREVPFRFPTWASSWNALRMGWTMFVYNGAVSLYMVGNTLVLGFFAPPRFVGYYAGAEKFVMASLGLFEPLRQVLYPRLSHLIHHDKDQAVRLARLGTLLTSAIGALMGLLIFLMAPLLVRVFLGEGFAPAVPALRILALLLPLDALCTALHGFWMLPARMDRPFNAIILGTGLMNLVLALVLAPGYLHLGVAWAAVGSYVFMTVSSIYVLVRWRDSTPKQQ